MDDFTAAQQAQILAALADLLFRDGQENLSRGYLDGAIALAPDDFAARIRALERGGVSAGHVHANRVLRLAGYADLWNAVLEGNSPICSQPFGPDSTAEQIAEISALFRDKQRQVLAAAPEAIPQAARLLMLRDMLNVAWWQNARFYGCCLYSESGCQQLNQIMATWKPFQPEMDAFTRFLMKSPLKEHDYGAIRRGFTGRQRPPDTLDYVRAVRRAFGTWLMDEAQNMYPCVPTVQSDLLADYESSDGVYVFQSLDHLRANVRRLAPLDPFGHPAPGLLPSPDDPAGIPEALSPEFVRPEPAAGPGLGAHVYPGKPRRRQRLLPALPRHHPPLDGRLPRKSRYSHEQRPRRGSRRPRRNLPRHHGRPRTRRHAAPRHLRRAGNRRRRARPRVFARGRRHRTKRLAGRVRLRP
jgi:hypothetical protein